MKTIKPCKVDGEVPPRVDLKRVLNPRRTSKPKESNPYIQKCLDEMFHDVCN